MLSETGPDEFQAPPLASYGIGTQVNRERELDFMVEHLPPDLQKFRDIFEEIRDRTLAAESALFTRNIGTQLWTLKEKGTLWTSTTEKILIPHAENQIIHQNYRLPKKRYVDNLTALDEILRTEIQQWADDPKEESIFIVAVSGLPGSGKTTSVKKVHKIVERMGRGLKAYIIGMDSFVQIEREFMELREKIARYPWLYNRLLYSQATIHATLIEALKIDGHGGNVQVDNGYNSRGEVGQKIFTFDPGKKVYIVEGLFAGEHLDALQRKFGAPGIKIYMDGRPEETYKQAIARDVALGIRNAKSVAILQTNLYGFLVRYGEVLKDCFTDYIVDPKLKAQG